MFTVKCIDCWCSSKKPIVAERDNWQTWRSCRLWGRQQCIWIFIIVVVVIRQVRVGRLCYLPRPVTTQCNFHRVPRVIENIQDQSAADVDNKLHSLICLRWSLHRWANTPHHTCTSPCTSHHMHWTAQGSVFGPFSCGFSVCAWDIPGNAEWICTKFTRMTCLVLRSDKFEGQGQGQGWR